MEQLTLHEAAIDLYGEQSEVHEVQPPRSSDTFIPGKHVARACHYGPLYKIYHVPSIYKDLQALLPNLKIID